MNLTAIAKAYLRRISRNEITIDDVPLEIKSLVEELIENDV